MAVLHLAVATVQATSAQKSRSSAAKKSTQRVNGAPKTSNTRSPLAARKRKHHLGRKARHGKSSAVTGLTVVLERELAQGVRYVTYNSNGAKPIVIHAIRVDRTVPANAIRIAKALSRFDGLERLVNIADAYATEQTTAVLAAVNANFWRAGRSTVIGPCVVDGEPVEMLSHKSWSTAMFDVEDKLTIDTFKIRGTFSIGGTTTEIASVNRRVDSGIVVYNRFCGGKVPTVQHGDIDKQIAEIMRDTLYMNGDSTEQELTREQLRREFVKAQQEANQEFPMWKIRVRHLRSPAVNMDIPVEVISVDTGSVDVPLRGSVVSVPRGVPFRLPRAGERGTLRFSTNTFASSKFMNAVSGTPRLIRDGRIGHEAKSEGVTSTRFIQQPLARTAIGTDRTGNELVFVAIPASSATTSGASLDQLSSIMKLMGCHQAMNLDGGGSSGMVVQGDHVFFEGEDPLTRRIAVALAVVRRSHILRSAIGGTVSP